MKLTYQILLIIFCISSFIQCKTSNTQSAEYKMITGKTMGTTYNISYQFDQNLKSDIDSILIDINNAVSTYIPSSIISILNTDNLGKLKGNFVEYTLPHNEHFINNFQSSQEVYISSNKYFDPTIMPLVNYWGFGYKKKKAVNKADSLKIKTLQSKIGLGKWQLKNSGDHFTIVKPLNTELDFSGIAKGYAVDFISEYLQLNDINNYMVEIGGEVYTSGHNPKKSPWTIGLSKPDISANFNDYSRIVSISGQGMASSGNYRNFYEVNGKTYGHEINPHTGYPEINNLLGVSVIAQSCKLADAYATAFMVMGLDKSKILIESLDNIEACFFYRSEKGEIATLDSSEFHLYDNKTD